MDIFGGLEAFPDGLCWTLSRTVLSKGGQALEPYIHQPSVKNGETASMVGLMRASEYRAYPSPYCGAFSPTLALRKGYVSGPFSLSGVQGLPWSCLFSHLCHHAFLLPGQARQTSYHSDPALRSSLPSFLLFWSQMRDFQCSGFCIVFTPRLLIRSFGKVCQTPSQGDPPPWFSSFLTFGPPNSVNSLFSQSKSKHSWSLFPGFAKHVVGARNE